MYCSTISKTTISVEVCIFSVSQLSQISHVRAIPAPTSHMVGFCSGCGWLLFRGYVDYKMEIFQ